MVARKPRARPDLRVLAPPVLKGLRRLRGVSREEMAQHLGGLSIRAYENFENGKGRLNVERIQAFAARLEVDAQAILAAFEIRSPQFALRCANNKLMEIHLMELERFDNRTQDAIVGLDPLTLMHAYRAFYEGLEARAREQGEVIDAWRRDRDRADEPPNEGGD